MCDALPFKYAGNGKLVARFAVDWNEVPNIVCRLSHRWNLYCFRQTAESASLHRQCTALCLRRQIPDMDPCLSVCSDRLQTAFSVGNSKIILIEIDTHDNARIDICRE